MLTSTRNFLSLALVGILVALAAWLFSRNGAGASDSGAALLGGMIAGGGLTMCSLVPPALRLLLRGWRRVGIGPRDPGSARRLSDNLSLLVWALWTAGAVFALPPAWAPLLADLAHG